jgi:hypothetical protein
MTINTALVDALHAPDPFPGLAEKLGLYGRLIGNWTMLAHLQPEPGTFRDAAGEIRFGWILAGRAIQDIWNLPGYFYGTTLRIYDPGRDAWHILWNEPVKQFYTHMIGRAEGPDIVQLGRNGMDKEIRWRFTEMTPDAFRWLGEIRDADGTWFRQTDIHARRVPN